MICFPSQYTYGRMNPLALMSFNLTTCLTSCGVLLFYAQSSSLVLHLCVTFLGVGTASITATVLLWTEEHIRVTGKTAALFNVATIVGDQVGLGQVCNEQLGGAGLVH